MPIKFLLCDTYDGEAVAKLKGSLDCTITRAANLKPTPEELKDIDALLIRSRTNVSRYVLDSAPNLKFVVTATSGFDHIDYKECEKKKVTVCFTPEANAASAAELTIGLMLSLMRQLPKATAVVPKKLWREDNLRAQTVNGKTLGIFGLGRIGQRVTRAAQALGMKVIACDPYQSDEVFTDLKVDRYALLELLLMSDVVSLHTPLTKETHHLMNHQTFSLINPEAVLINTARGRLVQESELIVALDKGLIRGVALDVFEKEPLPNESLLRGRPNVILTPHVGAFTTEAIQAASMQAVELAIDFFKTGQARFSLPLQARWFEQIIND